MSSAAGVPWVIASLPRCNHRGCCMIHVTDCYGWRSPAFMHTSRRDSTPTQVAFHSPWARRRRLCAPQHPQVPDKMSTRSEISPRHSFSSDNAQADCELHPASFMHHCDYPQAPSSASQNRMPNNSSVTKFSGNVAANSTQAIWSQRKAGPRIAVV